MLTPLQYAEFLEFDDTLERPAFDSKSSDSGENQISFQRRCIRVATVRVHCHKIRFSSLKSVYIRSIQYLTG